MTLSLTSLDYIYTLEIHRTGCLEMAAPISSHDRPAAIATQSDNARGQMCGGEHPVLSSNRCADDGGISPTNATLLEQSLIANPSHEHTYPMLFTMQLYRAASTINCASVHYHSARLLVSLSLSVCCYWDTSAEWRRTTTETHRCGT